jgi:6-phosphogluconolactonase
MTNPTPFVIRMNDEGTYLLEVQPDVESLMHLAAKAFVFWSQKAIERRGVFHVALSGGGTPRALYRLLATREYAQRILWDRVQVWWGDERNVPSDHADSNYKMVNDNLLSHVPIPSVNVHRARTELGAEQAAAHYEIEIQLAYGQLNIDSETDAIHSSQITPSFDLVLLGMGDDGHTASLFPHTEALNANQRWVVSHFVEKVNMRRITFTAPLINAADTVIFLASGGGKADILRRVLMGELAPNELPSQLIAPRGKMFWMVDAAAAASLITTHAKYPETEFIYRRALSI